MVILGGTFIPESRVCSISWSIIGLSREYEYKNTEQESWSREWQTKICYFPFARIVQTWQPQLASDSFFEVKLGTLSKSFGAQNDNFFNMRSSTLGN